MILTLAAKEFIINNGIADIFSVDILQGGPGQLYLYPCWACNSAMTILLLLLVGQLVN